MAVIPPAGGNALRAALQAKGWSYSRLAVELRRRAERDGVTLPKHESLVTLITRWVNNRQQPDGFYRDLLSRTLGLPQSELFDDAPRVADLTAGAEPWLLARALDASAVGGRSLDLLEAAVADFARRYPSTAPADLLNPVRQHYQDAVRLLAGPLRVAHRRRLSAVAGVLAGLGGSLSFDLEDQARAAAYFEVARQAAEEAEDRDLAEVADQPVQTVLGVGNRGAVADGARGVHRADLVGLLGPVDPDEHLASLGVGDISGDGSATRVITDWRSGRVFPWPLGAPGGRRGRRYQAGPQGAMPTTGPSPAGHRDLTSLPPQPHRVWDVHAERVVQ
jgi:transcriptional regulator with XRE-family HTH domain